jgi:tetratricopeptide (TPR) repeat protein
MVLATVVLGTSAAWAQRGDANVLAAKAAIAYEDKQYDEALILLNKAIALVPQHERSLFYKGLVYLAQKRPQEAIAPLETVHQLRPDDLDIQHHLGVAYFSVGNYDKAKPFLDAVYDQNPDTENMGYYVGFLRYREKQYGKAVEAFDHNKPPSADIQQLNGFYRGLALGVLGLPSEAMKELEQVQRTQAISPLTQSSIRIREALSAGQIFGPEKRFRFQISVEEASMTIMSQSTQILLIPFPS